MIDNKLPPKIEKDVNKAVISRSVGEAFVGWF